MQDKDLGYNIGYTYIYIGYIYNIHTMYSRIYDIRIGTVGHICTPVLQLLGTVDIPVPRYPLQATDSSESSDSDSPPQHLPTTYRRGRSEIFDAHSVAAATNNTRGLRAASER